MAPTSIRIQSVFFGPHPDVVDRYLRGVRQAVALLKKDNPETVVDVAIGDCSPLRSLSGGDCENAEQLLVGSGVRAFHYEFFAENLGHGGAQNRLLAGRGDAEFVLVLNPDTCMGPRALVGLLRPMGEVKVAIAEARQLPLEHQKAYDKVTGDTSWATGACSLIRCSVLDEVGLFDAATFFLHADDVDLSWRCRLAGYRVVHEPTATVFHDKRLSSSATYIPSDAEVYHSALAAVLIASKYSRPDIADDRLGDLDRSPQEVHERAAAEYRRRKAAGELAEALDPLGTVAQFQTYAYADLRFDYSF